MADHVRTKFEYDAIAPSELTEGVAEIGMEPEEFLRITGTGQMKRWGMWMAGECDIPHDAHLLLAIFEAFPQTIDFARKLADEYGQTRDVHFTAGKNLSDT